jgi:vacuolar-type H+-ATPase subunit H
MAQNEIELIKEAENEALAQADRARYDAEQRIKNAQREAQEFILRQKREGLEAIQKKKEEAERKAILTAEHIRGEGERVAEITSILCARKMPESVRYIVEKVGGVHVTAGRDAEGHRGGS